MKLHLGGFTDEPLIAGDEASRRQARQELQRTQELHAAMRCGLPEIERNRLRFDRFYIVDEKTGDLYGLLRGAVDPQNGPAVAFFITASGDVQWLENPPGGARTLDELEQQRAKREQRRAEQAAAPRRWAKR